MGTKVGEGRVCGSLRHLTVWLQVEEADEQRFGSWEVQGGKRSGQLGSCQDPFTNHFSPLVASMQKNWHLSRRNEPWFWLLKKRQIWQPRQKLPRSEPNLLHSGILKEEAKKGAH